MTDSNNHLRQNILTEQWILYAPERAKRPEDQKKSETEPISTLPEIDYQCPFCMGNESQLPDIIMENKQGQDRHWLTRVVPNKYPALTTEGDLKGGNKGIYLTMTAFGQHNVIVENSYHNQDIPAMSTEQVACVVKTYIQAYRQLFDHYHDILSFIIFRNHGPSSGTSLVHPHSQIIGTAIIPKDISDREKIAEKYFQKHNCCPVCNIIEMESYDGGRKIYENNAFLSFVPFAAEVPYEVWIVPKKHESDFSEIGKDEVSELAEALRNVLLAYYEKLNNPDYNYIVHSCTRHKRSSPFLHWYLQIRPRVTVRAGFEIGSGMHINPSLPENDAETLKDQIDSQIETQLIES